MDIKVSIITPVYNAESYLISTANSILQQTYQNWEWIVVDDCSSDNSYKILKELEKEDSRIRVFKNSKNSKAFATRNHALERSTGDFVAFIDADDLWLPNKLEIQLNFMVSNNYPFTYTAFRRFLHGVEGGNKVVNVPLKATYNQILRNNFIATSTVMINRRITGNFSMRDVYYDDFTLWLDLLSIIPSAYGINTGLMLYRVAPNSLSSNKIRSAIKVYNIFVNKLGFSYLKARYNFLLWALNTTARYLRY